MASPTAAETTSSASSSCSIDVTGSQAYRTDGWGSYSSNSTSTIVCLPIFFDSGFIVKHFAPSQMSLAPASPIAHFGLAPPLIVPMFEFVTSILEVYTHSENLQIEKFKRYYKRYFLTRIGPAKLTIFTSKVTTNNGAESYHAKITTTFKSNHPNIWNFCETRNI